MSDPANYQAVEQKARSMFGRYAAQWLVKPNRSLAQLSPYEMSQSADGARLVLAELSKTILID
jgi:uncharacterized protein (DUF2384 family)